VCRALDVSLIDFLFNSESLYRIESLTTNSLNSEPESQQIKRQFETVHLQQSLQAALKEEPPPTMKAVAQRLRYSTRSIRRHFPTLCSVISVRYLNHRSQIRIERVEQCCQESRQVATILFPESLEPTYSQVTQHLRKPAYFRDPIGSYCAGDRAARTRLAVDFTEKNCKHKLSR